MAYFKRVYYNLNEVYKYIRTNYANTETKPAKILNPFILAFNGLTADNGFWHDATDTTPIADIFDDVMYILLNEFNDDYVAYADFDNEDDSTTLGVNVCIDFVRKLLEVYQSTKERYTTLLGLYSAQSANLMNKVESIATSEFNDTPQNYGTFTSTSHLTNFTRNSVSNDLEPVMDRLDKIQQKYRNLVRDWANEFKGLFILGGKYEY